MPTWMDRIRTGETLLLDGAWGTQLQARGLPGNCPDAWNLTHAGVVVEVAAAYVAAGSQAILTNTFNANRIALAAHGLTEKAATLSRAGAELSRQAAGKDVLVFGSIGPSGKMLMMGDIHADALQAAFTEQATALAEGGVDALIIETMTDLEEALLALRAAKATGLPVAVSMVFDCGGRSMMGVAPQDFGKQAVQEGADIIGANCGQGLEAFPGLCAALHTAGGGAPVWAKPNAGLPQVRNGKPHWDMSPQAFAGGTGALRAAGAVLIGGCCGTTPEHIQALRRVLETRQPIDLPDHG